jgi:hypothetical protein
MTDEQYMQIGFTGAEEYDKDEVPVKTSLL